MILEVPCHIHVHAHLHIGTRTHIHRKKGRKLSYWQDILYVPVTLALRKLRPNDQSLRAEGTIQCDLVLEQWLEFIG